LTSAKDTLFRWQLTAIASIFAGEGTSFQSEYAALASDPIPTTAAATVLQRARYRVQSWADLQWLQTLAPGRMSSLHTTHRPAAGALSGLIATARAAGQWHSSLKTLEGKLRLGRKP
jgi:hypothetical protein